MSTQTQTEQTVDTGVSTEPVQVGAYTGQVKAFNPKKGYGFIAVHGENTDDVFVHQTNICPVRSTYRTLTRGEYVSFDISDDEKRQALNVRGVGGGTLRCDAVSSRRSRSDGQTGGDDGEGEFTTVNRTRGGRGRGGRGGRNGRGGANRGTRQPRVQNSNGETPLPPPTISDFLPSENVEESDNVEASA